MMPLAYCHFETPLGRCGIAWRETGEANKTPAVCFFQLPEATPEQTEAKTAQYCGTPQASRPPAEISGLIQRVCKHLAGELQDFQDIVTDLSGIGAFSQQVYAAVRGIPAGQTRTYGEVAKVLHRASAARAVGQALARNPITLIIPCHRVLAASGKLGGFSAHGGVEIKARMLAIEGVAIDK